MNPEQLLGEIGAQVTQIQHFRSMPVTVHCHPAVYEALGSISAYRWNQVLPEKLRDRGILTWSDVAIDPGLGDGEWELYRSGYLRGRGRMEEKAGEPDAG